jgi:hypothetical protein
MHMHTYILNNPTRHTSYNIYMQELRLALEITQQHRQLADSLRERSVCSVLLVCDIYICVCVCVCACVCVRASIV